MSGAVAVLVSAVVFSNALPVAGHAQTVGPTGSNPVDESIVVAANPILRASLDRIAAQSALWRDALQAIEGSGRRVKIVTPDQVVVTDDRGRLTSFDRDVLAEVSPVRSEATRVDLVVVVINLDLLQRMYFTGDAAPLDLQSDLDRLLIHEVYGHALPYLIAGDMSGRCADPLPNQRPSDACSIRRENEVRAELRLGRRTDRGFEGLALARRTMH